MESRRVARVGSGSASGRLVLVLAVFVLPAAACGGTEAAETVEPGVVEPAAEATSAPAAAGANGDGEAGHDMADHHGDRSDGGEGHHHGDGHDHGSAGEPTRYDAGIAGADQTIAVEVAGGDPVGGHRRVEVDLGSVVALMVTSDTAEEVHVHGYDILRSVSPGHPAHFAFTAAIPGVLEVELERSGRLLLLLEVS